jgi:hypothetical protein
MFAPQVRSFPVENKSAPKEKEAAVGFRSPLDSPEGAPISFPHYGKQS